MSATNGTTSPDSSDQEVAAQEALKRAYLHVSFGQYDEGIEACEQAAELLPEHYLPLTLKGSFELACGRMRSALGTLRQVTRRHGDKPLGFIYFAEACFLAGRHRQARRALEKAERLQQDGSHDELIEQIRQTWQGIDPSQVPPPLVARADETTAG